MEIPASYIGREQAFVKHTLLKSYLERLFMIVGQYARKICYVDCFAGPWQEGGTDLSDTSIAISLNIIQKSRNFLSERGHDVQFRALYIEKNKKSFSKLERYLDTRKDSGLTIKSLNGEFYDLRDEIRKWCGTEDFAFFFIDPTGWKDMVVPTLRPLLQRPNSEYLINFMYDFVLRAHKQESYEAHMQDLLGEVPVTEKMIPKEKEAHIMKLYCDHLKSAAKSTPETPRCVYVKIPYPLKDRTEYSLVYVTRHAMGIKVFAEVSESLHAIKKEVMGQAKKDSRAAKSGQAEMSFGGTDVTNHEQIDLTTVKEYWLSKLSSTPKRFGIMEFADMLEETGWYPGDLQRAFGELEEVGKAKNIARKGKRRTSFVHFEENKGKGEQLVKL
jgi:three-Cys-motif partner protein